MLRQHGLRLGSPGPRPELECELRWPHEVESHFDPLRTWRAIQRGSRSAIRREGRAPRWKSSRGTVTSRIHVRAVRLRKALAIVLELSVRSYDVQEVVGRTTKDRVAEPAARLPVILRYGEDGTAAVARPTVTCMLVEQDRHVERLNLAPVLLDEFREYVLGGLKPGGGGASSIAMRRSISIPCGNIPISVTHDAHAGLLVGGSGIVVDVKMLVTQLEVVVRDYARVELLVGIATGVIAEAPHVQGSLQTAHVLHLLIELLHQRANLRARLQDLALHGDLEVGGVAEADDVQVLVLPELPLERHLSGRLVGEPVDGLVRKSERRRPGIYGPVHLHGVEPDLLQRLPAW